MDAASGRLYGLLIAVEDRLGGEQAREVHHYIEVGEHGLALEEVAGYLAYAQVPVTDQERSDILALARRMEMDDRIPRALESCPRGQSRTGPEARQGGRGLGAGDCSDAVSASGVS